MNKRWGTKVIFFTIILCVGLTSVSAQKIKINTPNTEFEDIHFFHKFFDIQYNQIKSKLNISRRQQVSVPLQENKRSIQLPVLMYHHLDEEITNEQTIPIKRFEEHMSALSKNQYSAISLVQLQEYIHYGKPLPEKPILITFDDGYTSNYAHAFPVLNKYEMKAVFFVIGSSVGKDTYKDTQYSILPHFSYQEAQEMLDSDLIEIQSHTFDMHQWQPYETELARSTVAKFEWETDDEYKDALRLDFEKSKQNIEKNTTSQVIAFAYPLGAFSPLSEEVLKDAGVRITFTTIPGHNTVTLNKPQSLRTMNRYSVHGHMEVDELLELVDQ